MARKREQALTPGAIEAALRRTSGIQNQAADLLGVRRSTFKNHIENLGLRELSLELRDGQVTGRPPRRDLDAARALRVFQTEGSVTAAARYLHCHPDTLTRILSEHTAGVRGEQTLAAYLEQVLDGTAPEVPLKPEVKPAKEKPRRRVKRREAEDFGGAR